MKNKINEMFKILRKRGYFAKQNWKCCSSCGWSAIPKDKSEKVVFYHSQNVGEWDNGYLYLSWSGNGTEICKIAYSLGMVTQWDGDVGKKIKLVDVAK